MKPSQYLILALFIFIFIFVSIWTFNHLNPWIAILSLFVMGYLILILIEKIIKK